MQKRRSVLVLFVICALFCLGFGYAALTDSLAIGGTVGGTGNITEENEELFDIEFDDSFTPTAVITTKGAEGVNKLSATASLDGSDKKEGTATITITNMRLVGDKVVATFKVKNVSPDATNIANLVATPTLTAGTGNNVAASKLSITAAFDDAAITTSETAILTVTITLNESLLNVSDVLNMTISVAISATASK